MTMPVFKREKCNGPIPYLILAFGLTHFFLGNTDFFGNGGTRLALSFAGPLHERLHDCQRCEQWHRGVAPVAHVVVSFL
jgi:hypothetical protein